MDHVDTCFQDILVYIYFIFPCVSLFLSFWGVTVLYSPYMFFQSKQNSGMSKLAGSNLIISWGSYEVWTLHFFRSSQSWNLEVSSGVMCDGPLENPQSLLGKSSIWKLENVPTSQAEYRTKPWINKLLQPIIDPGKPTSNFSVKRHDLVGYSDSMCFIYHACPWIGWEQNTLWQSGMQNTPVPFATSNYNLFHCHLWLPKGIPE